MKSSFKGHYGRPVILTALNFLVFRIRYQVLGTPKISIVIANKDHVEDLRRCVTSISEKSTYDNYEIVIVENNSTTPTSSLWAYISSSSIQFTVITSVSLFNSRMYSPDAYFTPRLLTRLYSFCRAVSL